MKNVLISNNIFCILRANLGDVTFTGEVAEWLKAHAWKACKPHKGFEGSNPSLSARIEC